MATDGNYYLNIALWMMIIKKKRKERERERKISSWIIIGGGEGGRRGIYVLPSIYFTDNNFIDKNKHVRSRRDPKNP